MVGGSYESLVYRDVVEMTLIRKRRSCCRGVTEEDVVLFLLFLSVEDVVLIFREF